MVLNNATAPAYLSIAAAATNAKTVLRITASQNETADDAYRFDHTVQNFSEARHHLYHAVTHHQQLPEAVVIDVPLVYSDLKNFIKWQNEFAALRHIPIIYNRTYLTAKEAQDAALIKLVDDTIDLQKNYDILPAKCRFLKKAKQAQAKAATRQKRLAKVSARLFLRRVDVSLRRLLDITFAASLLLLLSPLLLLITIAIKLESRGPVFYNSLRAGKGYKVFKFYKFRTMSVDADQKREELERLNLYSTAESDAKFFKIENDPRITRVGAFLRNTSLDELPQLLNVLKGDMCLVGNRPLPLYEASTLTTNDWAMRFMAPAGITGLWQIEKRGKADMSVAERISLDINYAKNNGLLQDLRIIVRTPTAMFQKANV